jgi:hypothetical protein
VGRRAAAALDRPDRRRRKRAEADSRCAGFDHHVVKPGNMRALDEDFANFIRRM